LNIIGNNISPFADRPERVAMNLRSFFDKNPKVALAFSGGVDSSFLLYSAKRNKATVKAYFIKTQFQPHFELENAKRIAKHLNADLRIIDADILSYDDVIKNTEDRCYHCKRALFSIFIEEAKKDGFYTFIDGTNFTDVESERPGMRALKEMSIMSPMRECDMTKNQIRELAKAVKLPTWNLPSYSCLATRIPTGTIITSEDLERTERSENILFKMGFNDFRVCCNGNSALIKVKSEQMEKAKECLKDIETALSDDYDSISLDPTPR